MTLTDTPADPPEPEPNAVPEPLAPVEVPEPGVEEPPNAHRGSSNQKSSDVARFRPGATG
jgi:hypothetical protein